jgi:Polyphosphate kinase
MQSTNELKDPELYLSRELSKLAFNDRVLHEATDERNPLLERVKFLSIFTQNMDEFFMKRVGGLKQQIAAGITDRAPDGRTPSEQWADVLGRAGPLFERQATCTRRKSDPRSRRREWRSSTTTTSTQPSGTRSTPTSSSRCCRR